MTGLTTRTRGPGAIIRKILMGLVLSAVIGGVAAPAFADERDHDHHDHRYYHHHAERHHVERPGYAYTPPSVVYAPPPVVYAPPPGPPALNFVFPLNFR